MKNLPFFHVFSVFLWLRFSQVRLKNKTKLFLISYFYTFVKVLNVLSILFVFEKYRVEHRAKFFDQNTQTGCPRTSNFSKTSKTCFWFFLVFPARVPGHLCRVWGGSPLPFHPPASRRPLLNRIRPDEPAKP